MNDHELIDGLINHDNRITYRFFFVDCRPMLTSVLQNVFNYPVDYDEMVNLLYDHLMSNDCARLRMFQFKSSIYHWLKVVATRFFTSNKKSVIDIHSQECLNMQNIAPEYDNSTENHLMHMDIETLLECMVNRRYADVVRHLILEDMCPEKYAKQIGVTVDNLYNIKKRAIAALTRVAIKFYKHGS